MAIGRVDHINIITSLLEETRDFYERVVGLKVGHRPAFPSHGYWLYGADGTAIVHLMTKQDAGQAGKNPNGINHIGFGGTEPKAAIERITRAGLKYHTNEGPAGEFLQVFVDDPNGVTVEMIFDGAEAARDGLLTRAKAPV